MAILINNLSLKQQVLFYNWSKLTHLYDSIYKWTNLALDENFINITTHTVILYYNMTQNSKLSIL